MIPGIVERLSLPSLSTTSIVLTTQTYFDFEMPPRTCGEVDKSDFLVYGAYIFAADTGSSRCRMAAASQRKHPSSWSPSPPVSVSVASCHDFPILR